MELPTIAEPTFTLGGMTFTLEQMTPSRAEEYLKRNIATNRIPSSQLIHQYARDMVRNCWITTHEAIAFDKEGNLIDGQQRLQAVIESGKTVAILVVRGVASEAFIVVNTGRSRSPQDSLKMAGMDGVSRRKLAIARRLMLGLNSKSVTFTRQELKTIFESHRRAIDFAYDVATNDYNVAPVGAAIARAYYKQPRERLKQFGNVLSTGFMTPGDEAAVMLKSYVDKNRQNSKTDRKQVEVYAKTEYALQSFISKEKPTSLRQVEKEAFPLAGEAA